jgi:hypothetical protein
MHRFDSYRYLHPKMIRNVAVPGPLKRNCVRRMVHRCDTDQVVVSDDARRGIKIYPAWAGNISLNPGMSVTSHKRLFVFILYLLT